MIQIVLLVLKIIGITILVILGLLLLILALVLFVPVFYRVRIVHNPKETRVKAKASFLFPFLVATFQYLKKITYKVRIFGFALIDSERPKKEKQPKKKSKNKKTKKKNRKPKQKSKAAKTSETDTELFFEHQDSPSINETIEEPIPLIMEEGESPQQEQKEKKSGFFEKIRNAVSKIRDKILKIRETIRNLITKLKKLLRQKDELQRILAESETKEALNFAWDKLKKLLKHILPRKIKGYVAYGADNPATTGQVLGVLGVVYARTGQLLTIHPNFTEKQLECDVELKGRIQVFTLLVIAVKVFLKREFRQLISEIKGLKEIDQE